MSRQELSIRKSMHPEMNRQVATREEIQQARNLAIQTFADLVEIVGEIEPLTEVGNPPRLESELYQNFPMHVDANNDAIFSATDHSLTIYNSTDGVEGSFYVSHRLLATRGNSTMHIAYRLSKHGDEISLVQERIVNGDIGEKTITEKDIVLDPNNPYIDYLVDHEEVISTDEYITQMDLELVRTGLNVLRHGFQRGQELEESNL